MRPEAALDAARAAAARRRAAGDYADSSPAPGGMPTDSVTLERLLEWAAIDPDAAQVYSRRRLGAPITLVKRLLVRLMRQHTAQVTGQQARFNAQLVLYVSELADRVERLEEQAASQRPEV